MEKPAKLKKLKEILDEADRKAEGMTDAEIDAKLGPATRVVFNFLENIEYKTSSALAGTKHIFIAIISSLFISWIIAQFILPALSSPDTSELSIPMLISGIIITGCGLISAIKLKNSNKSTSGYIFWLIFLLNGSRISGGDNYESLVMISGFFGFLSGFLLSLSLKK